METTGDPDDIDLQKDEEILPPPPPLDRPRSPPLKRTISLPSFEDRITSKDLSSFIVDLNPSKELPPSVLVLKEKSTEPNASDYYDTEDSFIDDSELPKVVEQPKKFKFGEFFIYTAKDPQKTIPLVKDLPKTNPTPKPPKDTTKPREKMPSKKSTKDDASPTKTKKKRAVGVTPSGKQQSQPVGGRPATTTTTTSSSTPNKKSSSTPGATSASSSSKTAGMKESATLLFGPLKQSTDGILFYLYLYFTFFLIIFF
jgi:hypothetical protein